MDNIKAEIYEMDAIDEKMAIAEQKRMEAQGKVKCTRCYEWEQEEDLYNGICESCINEIVNDITLDDVFEYASTLNEEDEKSLYLEYLFNKEQVFEILRKYAKETVPPGRFNNSIKEYIKCDTGHYIDYLEMKGGI